MTVTISIIPTVIDICSRTFRKVVYVVQFIETFFGRKIQIRQSLLHGIELQSEDIVHLPRMVERIFNKLELISLIDKECGPDRKQDAESQRYDMRLLPLVKIHLPKPEGANEYGCREDDCHDNKPCRIRAIGRCIECGDPGYGYRVGHACNQDLRPFEVAVGPHEHADIVISRYGLYVCHGERCTGVVIQDLELNENAKRIPDLISGKPDVYGSRVIRKVAYEDRSITFEHDPFSGTVRHRQVITYLVAGL